MVAEGVAAQGAIGLDGVPASGALILGGSGGGKDGTGREESGAGEAWRKGTADGGEQGRHGILPAARL